MPRPIIGVTSYGWDGRGRLFVPGDYLTAVRLAGGIPVVLVADGPPPEEVLARVDGIILVGGGDVDPARYGAAPHETVSGIDPGRDAFELALARIAIERRIPLLGICRGAQVMNVALGGDLVQHVPEVYGDAVPHTPHDPSGPRAVHPVSVAPGSRLHQIFQSERVMVRSRHHQAVGRPAPGLNVVAHAEDGVIEAVEWSDPAHPFAIGVQWHPEDGIEHDPVQQRLFQALVQVAGQRTE
ncbi:peptidase C26 [Thermaerobacter marianensis DSM 12885]|uniref:Peptidase C26 n=1 Tax=Thermaerobacter marianensis (strain ATCC 700841 / DSM 12885 / JCM 10246 / 7p75a) TaxID=644966 RepID=E6SIB8_THEM7|nr:gamma-glutamyl-gamma-aminobutyrate hydrolase family protein [Thermaerobacter marianensis]ADU51929.1 peptidase C26 [Thermaerobacter marianensis DSM 12885]